MNILQHATFPANQDYHLNSNLSWTGMRLFMQNPLQYKHRFIDGNDIKPTDVMTLGSLVHSLVLTPNLTDEGFQVRSKMPLKSKADKEAFIDYLVNIDCACETERDVLMMMKADELRSLDQPVGVTYVDDATMARAENIAECITPWFEGVRWNLDANTTNVEAAFEAVIEGEGCQCKCDYIDDDGVIWDIKTTTDLSRWVRGMEHGDYLMGDAWYRMVIEEATGGLPSPIRYVGVSTTEPHDVAIRYYPEAVYPAARAGLICAIRELRAAKDTGLFHGVDEVQEPKEVSLPEYIINSLIEKVTA